MEITEVKVYPVDEDKLKAYVSLVFDGCFMVNDVKVIQGKDGLFVSMPSRRKKNGDFKDVAHPLNHDCRRMIESRVIGEYERVRGGEERRPRTGGAGANGHCRDGAGTPATVPPQPGTTLDEVEEFHLRDSFWSLS